MCVFRKKTNEFEHPPPDICTNKNVLRKLHMSLHVQGQYGKTKVRLVRIKKHDEVFHDVMDVNVECLLEGDIVTSYTHGDNTCVVPTDTVKNTVYALAEKSQFQSVENLGIALCRHFLETHVHLDRVSVRLREKPWSRLEIDGQPHGHAFWRRPETLTARIVASRGEGTDDADTTAPPENVSWVVIASGIEDLRLIKTTQSGFENFIVDQYTTLKPTRERIFCTSPKIEWEFDPKHIPDNFQKTNMAIQAALLRTFAGHPVQGEYSKSVQQTMYQMALAALQQAENCISVTLSLPNIHHFAFDLKQFGMQNGGIFYPTDDPSGLIKCTVRRKD